MTAVVSGQADIGLAGPEASIYVATVRARTIHPVIFAQLTRRDGSFLVGRSDGTFSLGEPAGQHHHRRPGRAACRR